MTQAVLLPVLTLTLVLASMASAALPTDIEVPGTPVRVQLWDGGPDTAPRYAISLDGRTFSSPRVTSYELELRAGRVDPLAGPAPAVAAHLAAGPDTELYFVQFVTQPLPEYRDALRDAGADVHQYFPRHAHIVRMSSDVRDDVAQLPFVRWIGSYHPGYRAEPYLVERLTAGAPLPDAAYNIMLVGPEAERKTRVAQAVEAMGGTVRKVRAGKFLVEATLDAVQLTALLRLDDVLYVDRWSPFETDMALARAIGGANVLETIEGWTGAGVRGEVIDSGFNLAHVDFGASPLIQHTAVGENFHGASTSGIIFGDGTGDPDGRGIIPDAQGIVAATTAMEGQARYDLTAELVQAPYYAVFQSASVGSARTTEYTTISADTDAMLFDFDILHCQSQSNAGNQESRPQAWAKNVVSIGGVRHENTLDRADDNWTEGASIGPAEDGRIKPDLCHFYDNIYTITTGSPTEYTSTFGGTSGATPIVAGHFGLFHEMWNEGVFNNVVDPIGSVFDNRPHMTTAKAMLINTAWQYDWNQGGPNSDIDRYKQGWGMPDLQHLYDLRYKMYIVDESDPLTTFDSTVHEIEVDPGEARLQATMTYSDPPGVPGALVHRINDLTLKVTSPTGTVYWGNHGLTAGPFSVPGGAPDTIDTVENVIVANPEPGTWLVEVIAFEINEDARPETLGALDADYALVVSGVQETLPPLTVRLEDDVPALIAPGDTVDLTVKVAPGAEQIVPGSEELLYRYDPADAFTAVPLVAQGGDDYLATLPAAPCGSTPQFYLRASGDGGTTVNTPPNVPDQLFGWTVGAIVTGFVDDFESSGAWMVANEALSGGAWERGVPAGDGTRGDPTQDADGSGACYLTENAPGNTDVDGGPTRLTSPRILLGSLPDPYLVYSRWFTNDDLDGDRLTVELSANEGGNWTVLESVGSTPGWNEVTFRIFDVFPAATEVRVRFSATDNPNDSVTEAGIDGVRVESFVCADPSGCAGDIDGDAVVDFADLLAVLAAWGPCPACPEDVDPNGVVDFGDLVLVLSAWGVCE